MVDMNVENLVKCMVREYVNMSCSIDNGCLMEVDNNNLYIFYLNYENTF